MPAYPLLIEPAELESQLGHQGLLVIDLSKPELYIQRHIPGALHLDYAQVVAGTAPVIGLLPDTGQMSQLLSAIGLTPQTHVVTYDDEGGGRAARLLWSLAAYGHWNFSLLNGGLHAWANEGHPLNNAPVTPTPTNYHAQYQGEVVAEREYILARLHDPDVKLLDTRSPGEYHGTDKRAERVGHIPGAVNIEWTQFMDKERNLRLQPRETLEQMLAEHGITPDKEVIAYCQTHHRSAHTWFVLHWLGYERVKGYPGAWSEWGNRTDTPVEI